MLRKKLCLMAVLAGSMFFAGTLLAENTMRCGTHVIEGNQRHGGGKYEVLKKCGEPKMRMGNTWIYEKSGQTREVRFNDAGIITSIR